MATQTRTKRGRRRAPPRRPDLGNSTSPPTSSPACRMIAARELAAMLGVDRKTVYEGAARGEIPSVRVGRRVLFPRTAIETWLDAARSGGGILTSPTRVAGKPVTR